MASNAKRTTKKITVQPTHKQIIVKDATGPDEEAKDGLDSDASLSLKSHSLTLTPPPDLVSELHPKPTAEDETQSDSTEQEKVHVVDSEQPQDAKESAKPEKPTSTDKVEITESQPDNTEEEDSETGDNDQSEPEAPKDDQHTDATNKLIESEQYFLPINRVEKRHNRRVALVGLVVCLVLSVTWLDIALDAGLIPNTYHLPHTRFFVIRP